MRKQESPPEVIHPIVIEVDELIHTDEHPICGDPTCDCAGPQPVEVQMLTAIRDTLHS